MIATLCFLAFAQDATYKARPATDFWTDKEIDAFVVDSRTFHVGGDEIDPLWLVRMVNKLQPMGRDKGLAMLREIAERRVNVGDTVGNDPYWLANLLFEIPESGSLPCARIGAIFPAPPQDLKLTPRYPLLVYADVPLVRFDGLILGGAPEPVITYAERLAQAAEWRKKPMRPPNDPFQAFDSLEKSAGYKALGGSGDPGLDMAEQLRRLVRNAYRPTSLPRNQMSGTQAMALYRNQFRALRARWDEQRQTYVAAAR